jgi:tetratricopeptide (TPR) repeat protein
MRPPTLAARTCCALLAGLLLSLKAGAEIDDAALAKARAAASAGDSASAIRLYDTLLDASPGEVLLLVESAQQLSWAGRYDEAIRRYDQALAREPGNRFARTERAKVLAWSGRYDEAADAFRALLAEDPDDLDARLGLARTLSWSGRQQEARTEYESILADHPGHGAATLGLAQTHAWSGEFELARPLYEQARQKLPDPKDAELGLAYVALWQGRLREAQAAATSLSTRYPGDPEVADLQRELNRATAPSVAVSWDQLDDTDRNLLTVSRLEGEARLPTGLGINLAYANYDMSSAGSRGSIDSLQATGSWSPKWRHRLEGMVGLDRLKTPTSSGKSVFDWGLTYRFPAGASVNGWVGMRNEPYRYSVPLIVNEIVVQSLFAGLEGSFGPNWRFYGEAEGWDVSDGNSRLAARLSGRYVWKHGLHSLEAGAAARWLDWDEDLDNGYFDPSNFSSLGATGRAYGPVPGPVALDYDVSAEVGFQSFDTEGANTRADPYYLVAGRLFWRFKESGRLELFGEAGSYASQGAEDWRYSRAGIRIVWAFGGGKAP